MNFFKKLFGGGKEKEPLKTEPRVNQPAKPPQEANKPVEEQLKEVMSVLDKHKRVAYIPQTIVAPNSFDARSKIGGYPFLRNEDDWPICPNCKLHMQLFLQLNLEEIPAHKDNGLIQLFYCIGDYNNRGLICDDDLDGWEPFSMASVRRKITADGSSAKASPNRTDIFEEKVIESWMARDDYPSEEEYEGLGIDLELDTSISEHMHENEIGVPIPGDKLLGWPYWIQGEEYPKDRNTGARMELLFQLDSEVNLPYMFGDSGIGHLTQSPDNDQELAFGWACH